MRLQHPPLSRIPLYPIDNQGGPLFHLLAFHGQVQYVHFILLRSAFFSTCSHAMRARQRPLDGSFEKAGMHCSFLALLFRSSL